MAFSLLRRTTPPPANPAQLLARARALQGAERLEEAEAAADEALALQERTVGKSHAALVPYLLVLAGILFRRYGWTAGRPLYDRAQVLRGPAPQRPGRRTAAAAS